jgi:N-acetyl-1-D-myo-inositol-2-amino-2-deoxy-alpha-D-glucopyranoside deacetylase
MEKHRTLIFVGAHPDDESICVGATLAHYAATGVKVYYIYATRGEVGQANPEKMKGYSTLGDLRSAELQCAAQVLGLTDVIHLGFRDSGMTGWKDNKHPLALTSAPLEQVVDRIVAIFRKLKPDVVITFDPIGGYRHPDHIVTHNAAVKAFYAAGDKKQYPESGTSFQPKKLYFNVTPRRLLRMEVRVSSFLGRDMHKVGKNKNIDLTEIAAENFPVNAVIRPAKKAVQAREKAMLCHASMLSCVSPSFNIFSLVDMFFGYRECYMRAYPPVKSWLREHDLFKGIK